MRKNTFLMLMLLVFIVSFCSNVYATKNYISFSKAEIALENKDIPSSDEIKNFFKGKNSPIITIGSPTTTNKDGSVYGTKEADGAYLENVLPEELANKSKKIKRYTGAKAEIFNLYSGNSVELSRDNVNNVLTFVLKIKPSNSKNKKSFVNSSAKSDELLNFVDLYGNVIGRAYKIEPNVRYRLVGASSSSDILQVKVKDIVTEVKNFEHLFENNLEPKEVSKTNVQKQNKGSYSLEKLNYDLNTVSIDDGVGVVKRAKRESKSFGLINTKGDLIGDFKYKVAPIFSNGLAFTKDTRENGFFIDNKGNVKIEDIDGKKIVSAELFKQGVSLVGVQDKDSLRNVFISKNGKALKLDQEIATKHLLNPQDEIAYYTENINKKDKLGLVNTKTKEFITLLEYYLATPFSGEKAIAVDLNLSTILVNTRGQVVKNFSSKYGKANEDAGFFENWWESSKDDDYFVLNFKSSKSVIFDKDYNEVKVLDNLYDQVYGFNYGVGLVVKDKKYGYINNKGEEIVPPVFDNASFKVYKDKAFVKKDGKSYILTFGK